MFSIPAPTGLGPTFALILDGLRRSIAARAAKDHLARPLLVLVHGRLGRLIGRFGALVAKFQAGTLKPPRRRTTPRLSAKTPPPETSPSETSPPKTPPPKRLPRSFAWLIRLVPYEAACFGSQLQHLMSQAEMVSLIEAAPPAGRLLRPLCQALAIPLPERLKLPRPPPRPRRPRPAPPEPPGPPEPSGPPEASGPPGPPTPPGPPGPRGRPEPGVVWRRWRGIWMPEPVRPKIPG